MRASFFCDCDVLRTQFTRKIKSGENVNGGAVAKDPSHAKTRTEAGFPAVLGLGLDNPH